MTTTRTLSYVINDILELNLSYMPFIKDGGLFIPTTETFSLGDHTVVTLQLPQKKDVIRIEGKVVWITPKNALHHVTPGVGVQFIGADAHTICSIIEGSLDPTVETGAYSYGFIEEAKKKGK
jgi:type IV pilus assembly protein PilZ